MMAVWRNVIERGVEGIDVRVIKGVEE